MSALDLIDAAHARIPGMACEAGCSDCCGPVAMSAAEWERIKASGANVTPKDLTCPMLDRATHRCTVYAIRPTICRLMGVARGLPCLKVPCLVPMSDADAFALLGLVDRLGAPPPPGASPRPDDKEK